MQPKAKCKREIKCVDTTPTRGRSNVSKLNGAGVGFGVNPSVRRKPVAL